jgi:hypothetical protein
MQKFLVSASYPRMARVTQCGLRPQPNPTRAETRRRRDRRTEDSAHLNPSCRRAATSCLSDEKNRKRREPKRTKEDEKREEKACSTGTPNARRSRLGARPAPGGDLLTQPRAAPTADKPSRTSDPQSPIMNRGPACLPKRRGGSGE